MATAIKAIPTLKGKEARAFLQRTEGTERSFKGFYNFEKDPRYRSMQSILSKAGMLNHG